MILNRVFFTPAELRFMVQCIELAMPHLDEKSRHSAVILIAVLRQSPSIDFIEAKMLVIIKFLLNMIKARLPTFRSLHSVVQFIMKNFRLSENR